MSNKTGITLSFTRGTKTLMVGLTVTETSPGSYSIHRDDTDAAFAMLARIDRALNRLEDMACLAMARGPEEVVPGG